MRCLRRRWVSSSLLLPVAVREDCIEQGFGQCQLVGFVGQAQPSVLAKWQWIDQILGKEQRSRMLDQTFLRRGPIGNGW